MAKGDVLVRMKADVSNYDANIAKARKTLDGFKQDNLTLGGIINQSTKSVVAAAAQYASFAAVIGTVVSGMSEAISQGSAMAKEMEGVSMAFERLNQPGLLNQLREATHGTVNDLELMKQAVKFDNFNLSLEQMGTFLAFAQQQAKDTGQDINYLVDSIVTGLGRKSLPILDNLGLSAEEIRDRMKETGDMTTAVAQIIQERMDAAGGYVETAADRAAQAQVRLDNAMIELGNTMNSLTGEASALWTEMEVGGLRLLNGVMRPLVKLFNSFSNYINSSTTSDEFWNNVASKYDNGSYDDKGRYIKDAISSIPEVVVTGNAPKKAAASRTSSSGSSKEELTVQQQIAKLEKEALTATLERREAIRQTILDLDQQLVRQKDITSSLHQWDYKNVSIPENVKPIEPSADKLMERDDFAKKTTGSLRLVLDEKTMKQVSESMKGEEKKEVNLGDAMSQMAGGMSQVVGGLEQLGIDIPEGLQGVIGGIQAVTGILTGIMSIASTIAAIASADAIIPFHTGGVVRAAGGYRVPGNYGYDAVPALLTSGETVLTRAQAGNLASQLEENGLSLEINLVAKGEELRGVLNNNGRRTGRGEFVQTKKLRR